MLSKKDFSGECFNYYLHFSSAKHAVILIYCHFIHMRFSSGGILMSQRLHSKKVFLQCSGNLFKRKIFCFCFVYFKFQE